MSQTKYSYELKYKIICEVKKVKTISQVVDEFNLPSGGSLLHHWVKRCQHSAKLLANKDFDNEEEYQKQLETKENFHLTEIGRLKEKAKSENLALKKLFEAKIKQQKEMKQQIIVLKSKVKKLTKNNQVLEQSFQISQIKISELKFKIYQQEGLKIDNLELKCEVKKLLKITANLTNEKQKYYDQITTTKLKQEIILETGKTILGSGSQYGEINWRKN